MTLRPAPTTAVGIVAVLCLAWAPLLEVFDGWDWAIRVGLGIAVAAAIAVALESIGRTPLAVNAAVAGLGALTWAGTVTSESFRRDPISRDALGELRDGVFEGWGALLDDDVPLRDPVSAEIFVAVLAWIFAAATIHLTARRPHALPTMGVSALVIWIATAAALPRDLAPGALGALVGVAVLLVVTTLTHSAEDRWSVGRVISLVTMLGLTGVVAAYAGAAAGTLRDDPIDPRSSRETAVVDITVPDILGEFSTRRSGNADVMTVEATTAAPLPSPLRLRLQTYDLHDGERWLATTEYREVATFPSPQVPPPGEQVGLDIRLREIDGPWLPLPDRLLSIDVDDLRWNSESQTALYDGDLTRYRLTGTVVDRTGLEGLDTAEALVDERYTQLPDGLPALIGASAEQAAAGADDAIEELDALTTLVRELGRDDTLAPGQTVARLRNDLAGGEPTGAVQLASLHALMARTLGHPTRVVVGYVPVDPDVVAADLHVWTEVAFPGVGWVPLDPVPPPSEPAQEVVPDQTSTTTTLPEDTVIEARALPRELGPGEDPDEPEVTEARNYTWADLALAVAVVILVTVGGLVAVRWSRRRLRRREEEATDRVLGAWAELVDRMREAGAPVTPITTVDDIVFMAERMDRDLGIAASQLASLASQALHGPQPPRDADAERAWDHLLDAEIAMVTVRGRRAVLARFLDPRALRYRAPEAPPSRR